MLGIRGLRKDPVIPGTADFHSDQYDGYWYLEHEWPRPMQQQGSAQSKIDDEDACPDEFIFATDAKDVAEQEEVKKNEGEHPSERPKARVEPVGDAGTDQNRNSIN